VASHGCRRFFRISIAIDKILLSLNDPCGSRTRLCGLRGRRPMPIDERAELFVAFPIDECVGQESNLQCHQAGGLQSLGHANAQPTRICSLEVARVGVEPTDHEGLSFAALPVCVPCPLAISRSVSDGIRTHDLHRDRVAGTANSPTKTGVAGLCLRQADEGPQGYACGSPQFFSNPGWTRTIVSWV
jgi:hypothetical protein